MALRQFRRTDESYDLNVPVDTNQIQVLENQPRNENPTPTSSNGRRTRNRNENNASNMAAVPLRRSQRLIAQQDATNPTAPKEEVEQNASKPTAPKADARERHNDHSYCKRIDNGKKDGSNIFKKDSDTLQKDMPDADAKSQHKKPRGTRLNTLERNKTKRLMRRREIAEAIIKALNYDKDFSKIDIDGVTYTTFESTLTQTKEIDVYKMEHKITTNESEPNDDIYVELGPNGTLVPFNKFKRISWSDALQATHDLLSLVFPLNVLETHVISLRFAPLVLRPMCNGKLRLDYNKLYDIRYYVTERTNMSDEAFIYIIAKRLLQLSKMRRKQKRGFVVK